MDNKDGNDKKDEVRDDGRHSVGDDKETGKQSADLDLSEYGDQ
jgi:hypothetical protein